jgi:hypothetical protein
MSRSPNAPDSTSAVSRALGRLILKVPSSREKLASDPQARSRRMTVVAARRAAAISTGLSLPPGPAGLLTLIPDLIAIWEVQSRLVADIARAHGKTAALTRESMVYCLFKHGGAALLRDLVVRAGERFVVRRATLQFLQPLLAKLGVRVSHRVLGRSVLGYVPLLGAAAIGAYAYYDTSQVGGNAIELFASPITVEPPEARAS